jgi:hypothetical protein
MKKVLIVMLIIAVTAGLTGCTQRGRNDVNAGAAESEFVISDFFPKTPNSLMHYEGASTTWRRDADGNPFEHVLSMDLIYFFDYIHEVRSQNRIFSLVNDNESVRVEIYEMRADALVMINERQNFYDYNDITADEARVEIIILAEPLVLGNKWTRLDFGWATEKAEIISMDTEITVPFGTFNTMVVEIIDAERGITRREYYAPGIGLVKMERVTDASEQYQHLVNIFEGPYVEYMTIFLSWDLIIEIDEETGEEFGYLEPFADFMPVEYFTNSNIPALYTDALRSYLLNVFEYEVDPGARINFIDFNRSEGILHIDFTPAFVTEMMKLGEDELMVMQLLIDTLGYIYNAYAATISIDGEAYVSDNITIDPSNGDIIILTMYQDFFDEE